jgi:hypothetical protein
MLALSVQLVGGRQALALATFTHPVGGIAEDEPECVQCHDDEEQLSYPHVELLFTGGLTTIPQLTSKEHPGVEPGMGLGTHVL